MALSTRLCKPSSVSPPHGHPSNSAVCSLWLDQILLFTCFVSHAISFLCQDGSIQIWTRPVLPDGSVAFVFHNEATAVPIRYTTTLKNLGLTNEKGYNVTEVFHSMYVGMYRPTDKLVVDVNPTGVFFGKATAL